MSILQWGGQAFSFHYKFYKTDLLTIHVFWEFLILMGRTKLLIYLLKNRTVFRGRISVLLTAISTCWTYSIAMKKQYKLFEFLSKVSNLTQIKIGTFKVRSSNRKYALIRRFQRKKTTKFIDIRNLYIQILPLFL
jgi:hypothetical protein